MGNFFNRWRPKRRTDSSAWNIDRFVALTNQSVVPSVTVIVLIWLLGATFLTLSMKNRQELSQLPVGRVAPFTFYSRCSFVYTDGEETARLRAEAEKQIPVYLVRLRDRSENISRRVEEFFQRIDQRNRSQQGQLNATSALVEIANRVSRDLLTELAKLDRGSFNQQLNQLVSVGIASRRDKDFELPVTPAKIDRDGRRDLETRSFADIPDSRQCAALLAQNLPAPELRQEFAEVLAEVLGDDGNLQISTEIRRQELGNLAVEPVRHHFPRGKIIVEKGEKITPLIHEQIQAERSAISHRFDLVKGVRNLICSLVLLFITIFYLVVLRPSLIRDTRGVVVIGAVIAISLWINYASIGLFNQLINQSVLSIPELLPVAIPVELPFVLLAVMFGMRCALSAGFLVVTISVLMTMPEQGIQFQLAFRWLALGGICSLFVVRVVSYRTFFLRVFFSSVIINLLVNFDQAQLVWEAGAGVWLQTLYVLGASSFVGAVAALVLIFLFEIVFNLDTNMALSVLCNFNHPLLEKLRRQAPGTMNHSLNVATLAEDAARAINANPLRAKAGALFHDIGKINNSEYYTENNAESNLLHDRNSPEMSSMIIRDHVKNGLELARRHRLYRYIRAAIGMHHGNDIVRFFYDKAVRIAAAKNQPASSVSEENFRYAGNPPDEKELVILSLADACEAAARSLKNPSEGRIEKLVDDIIVSRYLGKQLVNGKLTLRELAAVRASFIKTLLGMYHGRIAYPEKPENETPDLFLAEPPEAPAEQK